MHIDINHICVPIDFSEPAQKAITYGATIARKFGAVLHLLNIVEDIAPVLAYPGLAEPLVLDDVLAKLERIARESLAALPHPELGANLRVERVVRHGTPYKVICQYAKFKFRTFLKEVSIS